MLPIFQTGLHSAFAVIALPASPVAGAQIVFLLLLLFVVAFAALASRLDIPYPIILVLAGLLLSFIPGLPRIALDPEVIFMVVLPPLLYAAAWQTSWREFSYNLVSICLLAFGLVGFTAFAVAEAAPWVFSGFDWRLGFVLGAVCAPTDALAATSIARRVGLPRRVADILEGESLVNDATGLLAVEFGLAMVVDAEVPTLHGAVGRLAWLTFAAMAIGLLIALVVAWFEARIDHGPIEIAISILVPYGTYMAAEAAHASGVLAVVACGLYLSHRSARFFSPAVRIQINAVWDALAFILNGLVFVIIGLQLHYVRENISGYGWRELLLYAGMFSALLILLRLLWVYPGAYFAYFIRRHVLRQQESAPAFRQVFVVGWTGMRGVIALAAAISLPAALASGAPFPQRNLIIFLTFSAILVTLVLQGLTLPPLIRALGLTGASAFDRERQQARREVLEAALAYLREERRRAPDGPSPLYDDLERHCRDQLANVGYERKQDPTSESTQAYERYLQLSRKLIAVQRETAIRLHRDRRINDEVLHDILRQLDYGELRLGAMDAD
jgi:Na+/H+ antiporter